MQEWRGLALPCSLHDGVITIPTPIVDIIPEPAQKGVSALGNTQPQYGLYISSTYRAYYMRGQGGEGGARGNTVLLEVEPAVQDATDSVLGVRILGVDGNTNGQLRKFTGVDRSTIVAKLLQR